MPLTPGTKLGAFEITGLLGKGGMGEVYRARDTKLGREVAIKVLSEALTGDAEMLARFEREAMNLAALDHPNIGALHDFCHENGTHFLVMQLVEGETLADRIARGPIPADEAIRIFSQIAEGLEAAHARGIIHRDLKPANIKVTADDRVKILDFGIAKSISGQTGGNATTPTPSRRIDPAAPTQPMSPTPSTFQTGEGTFIGTPHYMSPEQARGRPVDRRADIWAFGVCLYQALSGTVPFDGETFSDVISAVLRIEPEWNALPAATPLKLRELLHDCLERDPRFRLRDMGEAWARLNRARGTASPPTDVSVQRQVTRFFAPFPPRHYLASTYSPFALAPDGSSLVCALLSEGRINLHIRRMGALDFELLPGTENARIPFFSPDCEWIGFSQSRAIKAIPLKGGATRTIVECESTPIGAVWTPEDIIVWGELTTGLQKVDADGSNRAVLCTMNPDRRERWQTPGCNVGSTGWVLANATRQEAAVRSQLEFVSVRSGERRVIGEEAPGVGWYTNGGYLFFPVGSDVHAVAVDVQKLKVSANPVRVLRNVALDDDTSALIDISADGSMAYVPKETASQLGKLYWVDRRGVREQIALPQNYYVSPKLSPDGNTLAVVANDRAGNRQIHLVDWRRGVVEKITAERKAALTPIWHPDGNALDYSSYEHGLQTSVRQISLDDYSVRNVGNPEFAAFAGDRSPDGRYLAVIRSASLTDFSIYIQDANGAEEPFVNTPGRHSCPRFHPSGEYIVYMSNESGRWEVYVKPFHRPGRRIQVSLEGGSDPVWARDGSELFYRTGDTVFSVRVETDNGIRFGAPEALFNFEFGGKISPFIASFDVHPDGKRFVMSDIVAGDRGATGLVVVRNWTDELKYILPEAPQ